MKFFKRVCSVFRRRKRGAHAAPSWQGCNNVVAVRDGREYAINCGSNFYIQGEGNRVVLNCDLLDSVVTEWPQAINVRIEGNNNRIELELPLGDCFDVSILMAEDDNVLTIKTTKYGLAAVSLVCGHGGQIHIGEDISLRRGGCSILSQGSYDKPSAIKIGNDVRIAAGVYIRNSYGETMVCPETDMPISAPRDITIGDHVWIMSRCMIFAGCCIPNGSALAACSFASKAFDEENTLLAGVPAGVVKRGIKWQVGPYHETMENWLKAQGRDV